MSAYSSVASPSELLSIRFLQQINFDLRERLLDDDNEASRKIPRPFLLNNRIEMEQPSESSNEEQSTHDRTSMLVFGTGIAVAIMGMLKNLIAT